MKKNKKAAIWLIVILVVISIATCIFLKNTRSLEYKFDTTYKSQPIDKKDIPFKYTNAIFTEGVSKCTVKLKSEMCSVDDIVSGDRYLAGITLLSEDLSHLMDEETTYYIAVNSAGGPAFYGPFEGKVSRILKDALRAGDLIETEDYNPHFPFVENRF